LSPTGRPKIDIAPRKILLLRLRRLGDIVLTTPAITLLKRAFPSASLTYLVEEPFRSLVEGNPHLDRIIAIPAKQPASGLIRLIRSIRRDGYDTLLDFHGGPRASWITLLGGAKLKVGYAIKTKGFLYDVRVPRSGSTGPVHSVENHVNLVRALGVRIDPAGIPPLCLPEPSAADKSRVSALLAAGLGPEPDAVRFAVLHIGAGNRFRDWGAENLAALAGFLVREAGVRVALIGSEGDRPIEERILADVPDGLLTLAGRLSLMEMRELIRRAALFAGPDSGPMHVAASTPAPVIAWFGPTLPAHFAPWRPDGGRTVILERALDCRPCEQRSCVTADDRCLRAIAPREVFEACRPFLL
jgi:ADP-heptose:LPS heptosyltransferase